MTTRRRFRRPSGRSMKRKTSWQQLVFNDVALLSAGQIVGANLNPEPIRTGGSSHRGGTATILRMIMSISINPTTTSSAEHAASLGVYVGNHEAILGNVFNDPNSDPEQDWYYWTSRSMILDANEVVSRGIVWDVDIRTARRIRAGYDLTLVMAARSTNLNTVSMSISMRNLWALP